MQSKSKNRSLRPDRATSKNPNTKALPSPQSAKNGELTKVNQNELQERSAREIAKKIATAVLDQCCSRLAHGDETNAALYRRFIVQAAEANCDFSGREALAFDEVSIALERLAPRDTLEAMLSVQIVGVHAQAMNYLRLAALKEQPTAGKELSTNLATRLMRTFAALTEALARHRTKGGQKMRVEHVHVYQGGQAIVGQVNPKTTTRKQRKKQ